VLTVHHWADWRRGVAELRRVARRRVVVLTFDPAAFGDFWFVRDYLPEIGALDEARCPPIEQLAAALAPCEVRPVEVPRDCRDGMLAAFYARPERYLDPAVRAGMSPFAVLPEATVRAGIDRLAEDLRTGAWDRRYGELRERPTLDAG
jgi:hypothetical protein